MKEKTFLGKIVKIEYRIDEGVIGTKMVLWVRPMHGGAMENPSWGSSQASPFPVEVNERLTVQHIKTLSVGDFIEMTSLYEMKPKKDSLVITGITKRRYLSGKE